MTIRKILFVMPDPESFRDRAGIQVIRYFKWIPAFVGMTDYLFLLMDYLANSFYGLAKKHRILSFPQVKRVGNPSWKSWERFRTSRNDNLRTGYGRRFQ